MPNFSKTHFDQILTNFKNRDPELVEELSRHFSSLSEEHLAASRSMFELNEATPMMTDDGGLTAHGARVAESIVLAKLRPVLAVRDNQVTTEFLGPSDSAVWANRIASAKSVLDRAIPAIGRIEVSNNPDFSFLGTGWLVSSDIVVTNRHVAQEFARRAGGAFTFRTGPNGAPMNSRIDFLEEFQRVASLEYSLNAILWIAPSDDADVAFLRVTRNASDRPLPAPLSLAEAVAPGDFVATIGYPARDPRIPDQNLVLSIFGDIYDKKRLAPGQIMEVSADEVSHDCATLGGNSGSPVIDLGSGKAVALHFAGL
jgi:S1-C subfamily serine protease